MSLTARPRRMTRIHIALEPATLTKLKRKVSDENRDLTKHVRRLIEIDLGERKQVHAK